MRTTLADLGSLEALILRLRQVTHAITLVALVTAGCGVSRPWA